MVRSSSRAIASTSVSSSKVSRRPGARGPTSSANSSGECSRSVDEDGIGQQVRRTLMELVEEEWHGGDR